MALRIDFAAGPVWMVAGIPREPELQAVFVPGDEIMVVFTADRMRQIGFPDSGFLTASINEISRTAPFRQVRSLAGRGYKAAAWGDSPVLRLCPEPGLRPRSGRCVREACAAEAGAGWWLRPDQNTAGVQHLLLTCPCWRPRRVRVRLVSRAGPAFARSAGAAGDV